MSISITTIAQLKQLVDRELGGTDADSPIEVSLANDLDFSELDESDTLKYAFNGYSDTTLYMDFDGNGHEIKHLAFTDTTADWGMFGYVQGTVKNLKISDINVQCNGCYGITYLRGSSTMQNCHISGYLYTVTNAAHIIGEIPNGSIIEVCSFTGTIRSASNIVGLVYATSNPTRTPTRYCWVRANLYPNSSANNLNTIFNTPNVENCSFIGSIGPNTSGRWSFGFMGTAGTPKFCYFILENAADLASSGATVAVIRSTADAPCFYNNDVYDYGTAAVQANGTSAANIKSAAFLRSQGWSA